jgi:hypothetical protein
MNHRLACYTLFDITQTGVLNRARPGVDVTDVTQWVQQRNTQCNLDTIIQVISLRGQPENFTSPKIVKIPTDHEFGNTYTNLENYNCWTFDFEVHHSSVFEDGIENLGALYKDCQGVPMIYVNSQHPDLMNCLDITSSAKNIYFVKYQI